MALDNGWGKDELAAKLGRVLDLNGQRNGLDSQLGASWPRRVKTRGSNKGTSAIQRAGINLDGLGAADFFTAVALERPQMSLTVLTG